MDEVNETRIDASLLVEANAAHAALPEKDRQDGTATALAFSRLLDNKPVSGKERRALLRAIQFRLEALARLEMHGHSQLGAWTLPSTDKDAIYGSELLFEAAAQEPLVEINDEAHFNSESFFSRLLALSEAKGSA
ncbi:hypothetical protein ATO67_18270 [Agrobacterium bohemicum]|uniref:Uncharacterized protein n=1 Tax=Agrobacterium bohemicum TaxID=2052828 RepID=A0A135P845_9HYPH|nr:hypothetical protein ATO67_18270 [Agrobacterium bohemicum]